MRILVKEDNNFINWLVRRLDSLITKLREKGELPTEALEDIKKEYQNVVLFWMDNYQLPNVEPEKEIEDEIIVKIEELTDILNFIGGEGSINERMNIHVYFCNRKLEDFKRMMRKDGYKV